MIRKTIPTVLLFCCAVASAQTSYLTVNGNPMSEYGSRVDVAGDVNNDGVPDILVGAPRDATAGLSAGLAQVISGADGSVIHSWTGPYAGALFGSDVAAVGDVDQDGFDDVLIAAFYSSSGAPIGFADLMSGKTGVLLHRFTDTPTTDYYGWGVAGGGDLNGDGVPDLAVAATIFRKTVFAYSGKDYSLLWTATQPSMFAYGNSMDIVSDVNGDLRDDLVAGSIAFGVPSIVELLSGTDGAVLWSFTPPVTPTSRVAAAGDVDLDGTEDVVVGTPLLQEGGYLGGAVFIRSGKDGTMLSASDGGFLGFGLGGDVAAAGDLDQDGVPDVVAATAYGSMALGLSGKDGAPIRCYMAPPLAPGLDYGTVVAGGADFTGDGQPEVVIGMSGTSYTAPSFVEVVTDCAVPAVWYGTASGGGPFGPPRLDFNGCTETGGTVRLRVTAYAPDGDTALLFVSPGQASIPAPYGCTLLVSAPVAFALAVPLTTEPPAQVTLEIPVPPGAASGTAYLQAFVFESTTPGLAATNGLAVTIP